MKSRFLSIALSLAALTASAQMTVTFTGVDGVATSVMSTGQTLVQLPLGTDLATVMQKASFAVDGATVATSDIVPNPSALSLTDGQKVTFLYRGKAYGFQFSEGKYFTVVFTTDPHAGQAANADGSSVASIQGYVSRIVNMGKVGGDTFSFDALPGYVPQCDIAISMGDMDADSKTDDNDFKTAHAGYATAGIPFLTMCGNHDLVPDYWTGDNPDKGLTWGSSGGSAANDAALATVKSYRTALSNYGITDVQTFTDNTSHTQFEPFTFTFNGVRFYIGQTYWFQKPYAKPSLLSSATYYAPDGIISALEAFVSSHAGEASVWIQHYPFVTASDNNRWWLDQNDKGKYIKTSDTSAYGTSDDVAVYTESSAIAVATKKKDKLSGIIKQTKNPVHFSGHAHYYDVQTYNGLTDYTCAALGKSGSEGAAYIVLMKAGTGVVEVKKVRFLADAGMADAPATLYSSDQGGVAANLQQALTSLGADMTAATSVLENATTETGVADAVDAMAAAFDAYVQAHGGQNVDITAMLGSNADFETTQGTASARLSQVYTQPGWNTCVESFSNTANAQYIKLQQSATTGASAGSKSLFLRAKWQDFAGKVQATKQTALPAGIYRLNYYASATSAMTTNLCYVEAGGQRVSLPAAKGVATPAAQSVQFALAAPAVVNVSYGFTGGAGSSESYVYVDDLSLTYLGAFAPGVDMTGYIKNASFTEGTQNKSVQGSGGRVNVPTEWNFQYAYSGWNDTFTNTGTGVFNAWAGTISRAELSQAISLPNGAYRLTADVKTDQPADVSTIAIYGAAANNNIGRSEEVGKGDGDFANYSCAFDVTDGTATIGIRSDKAYYQVKNFRLTYLGATAEQETDASYLRQDYYWGGKGSYEFDASGAKYANASGVVVYPQVKNQLIRAASNAQFADTDNKIVDGICQRLALTDQHPFVSSAPFTAATARYSRTMANTWGTLCLPYAIDADDNATCDFYALAEVRADELVLAKLSGEIAAGTPVVVRRRADAAAIDVNAANTAVVTAPAADESGRLAGTFVEMEVGDGNYIVANDHFWLVDNLKSGAEDVTAVMTKGFRAYVTDRAGGSVKANRLGITTDEATGIGAIDALNSPDAAFYDIQGRRTGGLQKGLNIVRTGSTTRKIMVK